MLNAQDGISTTEIIISEPKVLQIRHIANTGRDINTEIIIANHKFLSLSGC
jgi:hypothetical protein